MEENIRIFHELHEAKIHLRILGVIDVATSRNFLQISTHFIIRMRKIDVALRIWRKVFHDVISSLVIPWFKLYEMNRMLCTLLGGMNGPLFYVL